MTLRVALPRTALLACMLAPFACQNNLPIASQIQHMRVLGAVTQVETDRTRSSPAPGEKAQVTWTMAFPDPSQDDSELASLFFVCTAPQQFSGIPVCQEFLDLARGGSASGLAGGIRVQDALDCAKAPDFTADFGPFRVVCVTGTPKLEVEIQKDDKAPAKLVRGIICRNGSPRFDDKDPTGMRCDPDAGAPKADIETLSVYGTIPIQYGPSTENHNPSIDAAKLFFHDPPLLWEPSGSELVQALNDGSCADLADADRVMSSDGQKESITLRYDADAREQHDGKPESLTFSSYSTFGKLSDRFTLFRGDAQPPLARTFSWELSAEERKELNKTGKHVRFYFTVLDGRGGYAVTRRDLCIVPQ